MKKRNREMLAGAVLVMLALGCAGASRASDPSATQDSEERANSANANSANGTTANSAESANSPTTNSVTATGTYNVTEFRNATIGELKSGQVLRLKGYLVEAELCTCPEDLSCPECWPSLTIVDEPPNESAPIAGSLRGVPHVDFVDIQSDRGKRLEGLFEKNLQAEEHQPPLVTSRQYIFEVETFTYETGGPTSVSVLAFRYRSHDLLP